MNRQLMYSAIKKLTQAKGISIIPISGNSMMPTLNNGDKITISSDVLDINVGDIVYSSVYANHGVVHRVYKVFKINDRIMYQTKGDNNKSPDPYYLYKEAIIGKMIL